MNYHKKSSTSSYLMRLLKDLPYRNSLMSIIIVRTHSACLTIKKSLQAVIANRIIAKRVIQKMKLPVITRTNLKRQSKKRKKKMMRKKIIWILSISKLSISRMIRLRKLRWLFLVSLCQLPGVDQLFQGCRFSQPHSA